MKKNNISKGLDSRFHGNDKRSHGNDVVIATLGGHSALEICLGAKKLGQQTLVIVQKGREKTYTHYFNSHIDETIEVEKFSELTDNKIIEQLKKRNAIFIPHRYCQVYCDLEKLEHNFPIPIFGNRQLLKYEERSGEYNQYAILDHANIAYPKHFRNPKTIDRLVIIKVKEAVRNYERAFFFATNYTEFQKNAADLIRSGKIKKEDVKDAVIEEYVVGAQINFNFFYSVIHKRVELLGTDIRRQTNIDGLIRIPASEQLKVKQYLTPSYVETGHIAVTVKESLLEKAFSQAEKLVKTVRKLVPPGIIGPFALQAAVIPGPPEEKIIVYDLSLRMPGSPGISFTPYSQYLFGRSVSFGERIAMEIEGAGKENRMKEIIT